MCHTPTKSRSFVKDVLFFPLFKEFVIQIVRDTCTQCVHSAVMTGQAAFSHFDKILWATAVTVSELLGL